MKVEYVIRIGHNDRYRREQEIKREVEEALKEFTPDKMAELLDFVLFLRKRYAEEKTRGVTDRGRMTLHPRTMPAAHLDQLTGMVEWGGDALTDSERLYPDLPSDQRQVNKETAP